VHLVVQTSFLGDMVLTTPLLEKLATRGPVDVVATPANAALLQNHPAVRDVIVYDKRGAHRGWRGLRIIADSIRMRSVESMRVPRAVDAAYMAQGSLRSATLARMAGVPRIVGFDTSAGRWLYSERVHFDSTVHHAARLLMLAGMYDNASPLPRPSLYPGVAEEIAVDALLSAANVGAGSGNDLIVLAPGSVWATKRWPGFDQLAVQLAAANAHARVVVIGSSADRSLAEAIGTAMRAAGQPDVIDATGKLTLLGTAALIRRARVIVTNDSAPLHLASAMNVPTVSLFGPTVPAFGFGPLAEQRVVVQHETLPCRPCDAHGPKECPLGHWRCMRQVEPDRVARDTAALLVSARSSSPLR
jgi:heptosyltransferase-2